MRDVFIRAAVVTVILLALVIVAFFPHGFPPIN